LAGACRCQIHRWRISAGCCASSGTRARLTQRELGLAVGYSEAQISRLEKGKRLPDPSVVAALFLPSLGLANEPELASRLHRLAETARTSSHTTAMPMGSERHEVGAVSPAMADDLADVPLPPQPNVHRAAEAAELADLLAAQRCVLCWRSRPPAPVSSCGNAPPGESLPQPWLHGPEQARLTRAGIRP
jgi:helix-turn-helix protein